MKAGRILQVVSLAGGFALLLASCKASEKTRTLYEQGEYRYKIVCPTQISAEEADVVTRLTDLFEDACGAEPQLEYDRAEDGEGTPEILIGRLDREESAIPELKKDETYWCVRMADEDIVINGSTSSALQAAMDYFTDACRFDKEKEVWNVSAELSEEHREQGYYRDRWQFADIPSYWGENNLNRFVYDCGPLLAGTDPKDGTCQMQTVTSTTPEEAKAYARLLEENGFQQISCIEKAGNVFYRYVKEKVKVSVNYFGSEAAADIIVDRTSAATDEISYHYEPKEGERTEYYLYALNAVPYTDPQRDQGVQGGLSMVVKCADNSIIMIDGGEDRQQMEAQQQADFLQFLYDITGVGKGEKIRIAAWYITHGHGDHADGFSSFLLNHKENLSLERIIANIPSEKFVKTADSVLANIRKAALLYGCREAKVHTGDVLQIADVTMEVLYTHEDLAAVNGSWGSEESNDASVAAMLTAKSGMSLQVTGDLDVAGCAVLEEHFTPETLACTLAQIPHHLYNSIPESWYRTANPQYFLVGQTAYNIHTNSVTAAQAKLAEECSSGLYCMSGTYGFAYENGCAVLIYEKQMY